MIMHWLVNHTGKSTFSVPNAAGGGQGALGSEGSSRELAAHSPGGSGEMVGCGTCAGLGPHVCRPSPLGLSPWPRGRARLAKRWGVSGGTPQDWEQIIWLSHCRLPRKNSRTHPALVFKRWIFLLCLRDSELIIEENPCFQYQMRLWNNVSKRTPGTEREKTAETHIAAVAGVTWGRT